MSLKHAIDCKGSSRCLHTEPLTCRLQNLEAGTFESPAAHQQYPNGERMLKYRPQAIGNVEHIVLERVGQEPVRYVSNICEYTLPTRCTGNCTKINRAFRNSRASFSSYGVPISA